MRTPNPIEDDDAYNALGDNVLNRDDTDEFDVDVLSNDQRVKRGKFWRQKSHWPFIIQNWNSGNQTRDVN
jgi:hypothetical protein